MSSEAAWNDSDEIWAAESEPLEEIEEEKEEEEDEDEEDEGEDEGAEELEE